MMDNTTFPVCRLAGSIGHRCIGRANWCAECGGAGALIEDDDFSPDCPVCLGRGYLACDESRTLSEQRSERRFFSGAQ